MDKERRINMLSPRERLSEQELARRHSAVRNKMQERGLELMLVSGVRFVGATGYLRYLTNWAEPFAGESLVFPREGSPIFCARTTERAYLVKHLLGLEAVVGSTANVVADNLRKYDTNHIGICGLKTMFADFYVQLTEELPGFQFEEVSDLLDEVRMVKSEEELGWVEQSASLGDMGFQTFFSLLQEGRAEFDVFVEIEHLLKRFGAENTYYMMAADPKPVPKFIDMSFDHYEKGDLVLFNAEIAGPAGYWTQIMRTLSVGEPSSEGVAAFSACIKGLEAGESLLKPGQNCIEVYNAIVDTIEQEGHHIGLHPGHGQGLDIFERPLINDKENVDLKSGMVIILHPHVRMPSGGGVFIGESYVITDEGCRRLHKSNREMAIV
jgi:Xaa-Pro aminopeptidase